MRTRPKKSFGQHFLADTVYVDRMLNAIAPRPGEVVVEIGPGAGALTFPLLKRHQGLIAIELDHDLIPALQAGSSPDDKLDIVHADILRTDLTALAKRQNAARLRLVGNLPYYISSPILFHCIKHDHVIADMHFMLQKEVVARMAATPGSKIYGRLSVMLQLSVQVEPLFDVPPTAFQPAPKVDSAVVRLVPLPVAQKHDANPSCLEIIVKAAFAQRRKTLANALRQFLDTETIRRAAIDPQARAEMLTPRDFVKLAKITEMN